MAKSVWKSEEGRKAVHEQYEYYLGAWKGGVQKRTVATPLGPTVVLESGNAEGPPAVLLHGSTFTSLAWMGDAPRWGKTRRILAVDLPGEPGLSEARRPKLASTEPELWLEAVLNGLGIEKAALVGMSLGGWFALRFASRFPHRVSALAGIVPGGLAPQRPDFLPKVLWYSLLGRRGQEKITRLVNHNVELPPDAEAFGNLIRRSFRPLTEVLPVLTDEDLRRLTMPLYYAGGALDALLDTAASAARLRQFQPNAQVHVLPDTGHVVLDRGPEIDEFLPK